MLLRYSPQTCICDSASLFEIVFNGMKYLAIDQIYLVVSRMLPEVWACNALQNWYSFNLISSVKVWRMGALRAPSSWRELVLLHDKSWEILLPLLVLPPVQGHNEIKVTTNKNYMLTKHWMNWCLDIEHLSL